MHASENLPTKEIGGLSAGKISEYDSWPVQKVTGPEDCGFPYLADGIVVHHHSQLSAEELRPSETNEAEHEPQDLTEWHAACV